LNSPAAGAEQFARLGLMEQAAPSRAVSLSLCEDGPSACTSLQAPLGSGAGYSTSVEEQRSLSSDGDSEAASTCGSIDGCARGQAASASTTTDCNSLSLGSRALTSASSVCMLPADANEPPAVKSRSQDHRGRPLPFILPPAYPNVYPTLPFVGEASDNMAAGLASLSRSNALVRFDGIANPAIRWVFDRAGFQRTTGGGWNVLWCSPPKNEFFKTVGSFQRVNHVPGTRELGRKDSLYRHVSQKPCLLRMAASE
jgi:hypothetical protein